MRKGLAVGMVALLVVVAVGCRKDFDFDADGKADLIYVDTENGAWYRLNPSPQAPTLLADGHGPWAAGDYDGDGIWEPGAAAGSTWWSQTAGTQTLTRPPEDRAHQAYVDMVPADYDGDGTTDPAFYQESTATWFIEGQAPVVFGTTASGTYANVYDQDYPVPADYDGDGKADLSTYNPATAAWRIRSSKTGLETSAVVGPPGALPVPADYDGNGKADRAVVGAGGNWVIEGQPNTTVFGPSLPIGGDGTTSWWPAVADYDGDGKADLAYAQFASQVNHAPTSWHIRESKSGLAQTYTIPGSASTSVHPVPAAMDFDLVISTARIVLAGKCAAPGSGC